VSSAKPAAAKPAPIGIIGVPIEAGGSERGTAMGPAALRTAGLVECFGELGREVTDHGDLAMPARVALPPPPPTVARQPRNVPEVVSVIRSLADRTFEIIAGGEIPLVLGGDHSLAMGSVTGVARHFQNTGTQLFVLWLDAHADFNTPATSPTGNFHGMPTAFLCGEPGFDFVMADRQRVILDHRNLIIFGLRSVDREERAMLQDRGVQVIDMRMIDEVGVPVLMRQIVDQVAAKNGRIHVSLDADYIDPSLAPGVGTPVPGGLTYRESHLVMEMLCDSGLVAAFDLVELNPFLDERGKSARLLVELTGSLFGRQIFRHPSLTR
jgi:arginase